MITKIVGKKCNYFIQRAIKSFENRNFHQPEIHPFDLSYVIDYLQVNCQVRALRISLQLVNGNGNSVFS
jgi:hypothetical protein